MRIRQGPVKLVKRYEMNLETQMSLSFVIILFNHKTLMAEGITCLRVRGFPWYVRII